MGSAAYGFDVNRGILVVVVVPVTGGTMSRKAGGDLLGSGKSDFRFAGVCC